jgi:DNA polymerase
MEYFLPGAIIGDIHGRPHKVKIDGDELTIIPLYHPAAALYNGSLRQTLIDDFMRVPDIISKKEK